MASQAAVMYHSKPQIERAIEELYAAGLELQGTVGSTGASGTLPDCIHRIDAIMSELREAVTGTNQRRSV